jgi:hypothetical protein
MNDAGGVGVPETGRGLSEHRARLRQSERTVLANHAGEIPPLDEFHHQEGNAGPVAPLFAGREPLAGVGRLDDVRVAQPADRLHLALEPDERGGVGPPAVAEEFERDRFLQSGVNRAVDGAHPALAELFEQSVLADPVARPEPHGGSGRRRPGQFADGPPVRAGGREARPGSAQGRDDRVGSYGEGREPGHAVRAGAEVVGDRVEFGLGHGAELKGPEADLGRAVGRLHGSSRRGRRRARPRL